MNQLTLRNEQLKFKTYEQLPIIVDEYMECVSN